MNSRAVVMFATAIVAATVVFLYCTVSTEKVFAKPELSETSYEKGTIPSYEIGAWGYIDSLGRTCIQPSFNFAGTFHSGFANASPSKRPGYDDDCRVIIDKKGKPIASIAFRYPGQMSEGYAVVYKPFRSLSNQETADSSFKISEQATYVDREGKLFSRSFQDCGSFCRGHAVAVISSLNKQRVETKCALITKTGSTFKELPGTLTGDPHVIPIEHNFCDFMLPLNMSGLVGFIDTNGRVVIKPRFKYARSFHEGLAAVAMEKQGSIKWGFCNRTGAMVIECEYDEVGDFHEHFARIRSGGKCGFIDSNGKLKIKDLNSFSSCTDFSEGLASITNGSGTRFFNQQGLNVFQVRTSDVGQFHNGLCFASTDPTKFKHYGYLDRHGKWAIPPIYLKATNFSEGLAAVCFDTDTGGWH